jgi:hypothetical protein
LLGNILDEATLTFSGTYVGEATRPLIVIDALHW